MIIGKDLEYELRRQTQDCPSENGVEEGSETDWPQPDQLDALDSPHAPHNHTNFLGLQVSTKDYYEMAN